MASTFMARAQHGPSTLPDDDDGMARQFRGTSPRSHKLGSRSCRACHQRKIRCDRGVPCTNCSRHDITCVYPAKDRDVSRKSPTLQNISDRLERLEILLSRFAEINQDTPRPAAGRGGNGPGIDSQTQIPAHSCADVSPVGTADQPSSNQRSSKSTWDLLLNDEEVVQDGDHSNIEILLQDVRPDLFELVQVLFPSTKLSYIP